MLDFLTLGSVHSLPERRRQLLELLALAVVATGVILVLRRGMQRNKHIVARFRAAAQTAMAFGDGSDGGPVADEYAKLCDQYGRNYVDDALKRFCHLDDADIATIRTNAGLDGE